MKRPPVAELRLRRDPRTALPLVALHVAQKPLLLTRRSIAAESARAVAAAEEQARALELEAAEAKRDAGALVCRRAAAALP